MNAVIPAVPVSSLATRFPLLAPLTIGNFRLYWLGRSISLAGDQFQMVALAVVALDLTHSAAGLGSVLMVLAVPRAVLMLLGGVATDRFRARSVMLVADMLQTIVVSVLALLAFRGALTLPVLLGYAALSGTVYAFFVPASNTIIPELVPRARVLQANALASTAFNLNLFLMPPLAGLTVALLGPAPAFGLNALSFLGSVLTLWHIRQAARPQRPAGSGSPMKRLRQSLGAARRDGPIWLTMGMAVVYCFGAQGATTVGLPALAKLSLGAGDAGVGLLYGARGIGALVAGLLLGSFAGAGRTGLLGCCAILGISLTMVAGGLAPTLGAALLPCMLSGLCGSAVGTLFFTLVQTRAPEEQRGGIMALLSLTIFGLSPLAFGLAGLVGAALNPRLILVGGGVLMGLAGLWGLSSREMRAAD